MESAESIATQYKSPGERAFVRWGHFDITDRQRRPHYLLRGGIWYARSGHCVGFGDLDAADLARIYVNLGPDELFLVTPDLVALLPPTTLPLDHLARVATLLVGPSHLYVVCDDSKRVFHTGDLAVAVRGLPRRQVEEFLRTAVPPHGVTSARSPTAKTASPA